MPETANIDLSKLRIQRETSSAPPPGSKRTRTLLIGGFGIVAIVALILLFQSSFSTIVEVEVATATFISPTQASAVLTASGYVVAQRKAAIASKATGRLVYLGVEEGDKVDKGTIIARIESADVEAALTQARATVAQYRAELTDAQQSHERAKKLIAGGLISQADYDAAQARYDRVVASIAAADAAVKAAEVQVENTRIRAPFDGTILTKNADVGEVVAPFGAGASAKVAVVTIADMSSLEVEADVSESNITRVAPGQPCEIVLDAYPDQRYRGFVHKIVPTADRAKATVMTKIRFVEKDSRVLPEMSAKVQFFSKAIAEETDSKAVLAIPASAVTTRDGKKVVLRLSDNSVTEIPVEVGRQLGNSLEILQGLSLNDKVVLRPSQDLSSGTKVSLKK
jgi:RND family efflux transporter MFP subunit